jgi:hypothetical protein
MVTQEFSVSPRLRLVLGDLTAVVRVRRGDPEAARVEVTGPPEYQDALTVEYDAVENRLEVREQPQLGVTVVGSGSVVVSGSSAVATGSVVSGSGGVTVVSSGGGRVVVNGVDVTDQVSDRTTGAAGDPPPSVTIIVPEGTDTGAERCRDLLLAGLRGRVRAVVEGAARLTVTEATGARLTVTGQSRATLQRSSGPASFAVSGQSSVEAGGEFGDVHVALSGQARLVGIGSFGQVTGEATGMARVDLRGSVAGHDVRTSGMARVTVGGGPAPTTAGDGWDF